MIQLIIMLFLFQLVFRILRRSWPVRFIFLLCRFTKDAIIADYKLCRKAYDYLNAKYDKPQKVAGAENIIDFASYKKKV